MSQLSGSDPFMSRPQEANLRMCQLFTVDPHMWATPCIIDGILRGCHQRKSWSARRLSGFRGAAYQTSWAAVCSPNKLPDRAALLIVNERMRPREQFLSLAQRLRTERE